MDYKKAYEEALERAREIYNNPQASDSGKKLLESMFPELADSEDERIRKELIKETKGAGVRLFETVTNKEFIAWLEKQKQEWSEEDVKMLLYTTILVESCSEQSLIIEGQAKYKDIIYWLKSLQNKVLPQLKQDWSEEDDYALDAVKSHVIHSMVQHGQNPKALVDWLKSLKQRMKGEQQ